MCSQCSRMTKKGLPPSDLQPQSRRAEPTFPCNHRRLAGGDVLDLRPLYVDCGWEQRKDHGTTLIHAIGAGITAAAGTTLALQLVLVKRKSFYSFQSQDMDARCLLFLVTSSLCQNWVDCAPAAFLRSGTRFSGSLSRIKT